MKEEIVHQGHWNDNLAACLATFCRKYALKISEISIFNEFCNENKMVDFVSIQSFIDRFKFEGGPGYFNIETIDKVPVPCICLVKGYRSVIVTSIGAEIEYIDVLTEYNHEPLKDFMELTTGHYYYINPESKYHVDPEFIPASNVRNAAQPNWKRPELIEIKPESFMEEFKERW